MSSPTSMSIASTSPDTAVHWTQLGLAAINESGGHGDECGPICIADYIHLTQGFVLDENIVQTIRTQAIGAGLMNTPQYRGMTAQSLAETIKRFYYVTPRKVVPWGQVNIDELHTDLKSIATTHEAIIVETSNAAALPDNQPGVQYHFILVWGLDSHLGYLTCNGDTETALRAGPGAIVAPRWYSWGDILASQPGAYIILPAYTPKPPPAPPVAPAPADVKGALADANAAIATLQGLIKKLEP